jgi:hypothetical protein
MSSLINKISEDKAIIMENFILYAYGTTYLYEVGDIISDKKVINIIEKEEKFATDDNVVIVRRNIN